MNSTINLFRAKILLIWYVASLVFGLLLSLNNSSIIQSLGYTLLFNGANGFFAFVCFKQFKINILIKFVLLIISTILIIYLYKICNGFEDINIFWTILYICVNISGMLTLVISRLILVKSRTYFIINFLIIPISFAVAAIFSAFTLWLSVLGIITIICVIISFVWFAGGAEHYQSKEYYYEYRTSDGRVLHHDVDNKYTDDFGRSYEISPDGSYLVDNSGNIYEING